MKIHLNAPGPPKRFCGFSGRDGAAGHTKPSPSGPRRRTRSRPVGPRRRARGAHAWALPLTCSTPGETPAPSHPRGCRRERGGSGWGPGAASRPGPRRGGLCGGVSGNPPRVEGCPPQGDGGAWVPWGRALPGPSAQVGRERAKPEPANPEMRPGSQS